MSAGSYIGETDIIFNRRRKYTVKSANDCNMFYISRYDFKNIIENSFPQIYELLKKVAIEREKRDITIIKDVI